MRPGRGVAAAVCVALAVPAAAAAQGGYDPDPTREQFVAQADPMCREANAKSARLFAPVEKLVRKGKHRKAGGRLVRGERVQLDLIAELRELDRPAADAKRIGKWLRLGEDGGQTVVEAGRVLKRGRVGKAAGLLDDSEEIFAQARRQVKGFGFRYCA